MKLHGSGILAVLVVCLTAVIVSTPSVRAASLDGSLVNLVICKSPGKAVLDASVSSSNNNKKSSSVGKAVRTLRVYESKAGPESGCLATYSKTNVEKTVGSSRQTRQCQSILNGIRKNLESSNWSCKQAMDPSVVKSTVAALADNSIDSVSSESDDLEKELYKPETTVR